ncbi:MAG: asparagine--tRNA ligase [Candidatus Krumholzibacteriia bacterium]
MQRDRIKALLAQGTAGQRVTVCGWVRTKRESKEVAFLAVNDGSAQDNLQLVVAAGSPAAQLLARLGTGAAVRATGALRESPAAGQRWEVAVDALEIFGEADPQSYPLQKKGHSLEFLRDIGHLRPRTNTFGAVLRVRNTLAFAVHEFFQGRGFVWAHTPIITASDAEGAGQLFAVTTLDLEALPRLDGGQGAVDFDRDFFGKRAYLTVSGQLEAEFMAMALGDVYTFGPTFRAENSQTSRHLSEFWMIEPEIAFADLTDDMALAEDFVKHLCRAVVERCPAELAFFAKQYAETALPAAEIARLADAKFAHCTYTDAVAELEKAQRAGQKFEYPVAWGKDLQSEHEKFLTDAVFRGPVIVTDYPADIKAFYMRRNDDGRTVAAMDVLVPRIGEIIGGSQREERLDLLEARMRELKIPFEGLQWYLDLRRYGSAPHCGFGLGFERVVQYLTGMQNIRDVIPCPRAPREAGF